MSEEERQNAVRANREDTLSFLHRLESVMRMNPDVPVEWIMFRDTDKCSDRRISVPVISIGMVGRDRDGRMLMTECKEPADDEIEWTKAIVLRMG